ncbi:MAG: terminase large subunit [bacterium]|nr:terminase large subunit [bacterium]
MATTAEVQQHPPRTPAASSPDPVTEYAEQVVAGSVVVGPHVRAACRRHLRDLTDGPGRGLVWDLDAVHHVIGFYHEILRLNGGDWEGAPFELLDWQAFIVGSLYGWKLADGYRRYRTAYIETGKGSGKSPLVAGIGLIGLVADGEQRAEIYAAATKKEQAAILFRDAVAMVDQSWELAQRVDKSGAAGREWNLAYHSTSSFFRPIASDGAQSGPRVHVALLDEIHEHKDGTVVSMIEAGTKSRNQALIVMITNSGSDKTSICWEKHEYAIKVASGLLEDDSFFGYVCALDQHDDPFKDESCWPKVNPSLHAGLPGLKYLRKEVVQAAGMPSKESKVRRLNFCEWVEAANPWIGADVWLGAEEKNEDLSRFHGRRCHAGLDLSSTQDLTSLVLAFEPIPEDPVYRLVPYFWLPGDGLAKKSVKDHVPYIAWRDAGYLEALPGRAINRRVVVQRLVEIASAYELVSVAYDRWRIEDLKAICSDEGLDLPLEEFGQGYKDMSPALEEIERRLLNDELKHDGNPVMTWCAANAVAETDPAGNRKLSKAKSTGRIDGMVAGVMATGASMGENDAVPDPYSDRGLITV